MDMVGRANEKKAAADYADVTDMSLELSAEVTPSGERVECWSVHLTANQAVEIN
jgi:hypothetical protein